MLKKIKMTTFAAVLCLFGFVLVPAAPAWAGQNNNVINYERCTQIKAKKGDIKKAKEGRDCYKTVAAQAIKEQKEMCGRSKTIRVGFKIDGVFRDVPWFRMHCD